jgi:type IV secretion system protein VirB4
MYRLHLGALPLAVQLHFHPQALIVIDALQGHDIYTRFGLNDRQIELIARATPKRHYYLQSARGNRLFELGLGPVGLALCGSSDPAAQARIDATLSEHGRDGFVEAFLRDAGIHWAADIVAGSSDDVPIVHDRG